MVKQNPHNAHLDAWEGHSVSCDPYCAANLLNYSEVALDATDAVSGQERTYDPLTVFEQKNTFPDLFKGSSWAQIRRDGRVKMTEYHVNSIVTKNFLVTVPRLGVNYARLCRRHCIDVKSGCSPTDCSTSCRLHTCYDKEAQFDYSHWDEVGDFVKWSEDYPLKIFSDLSWSTISTAIQETRLDAVNKSYRTYDALTDLMQVKQTASEFGSIAQSVSGLFRRFAGAFALSDLRLASRMAPKILRNSPSRVLRKIGSAWLAYRYSLMTTVYSVRDILKVIKRTRVTVDKAFKMVNPVALDPGSLPSGYIRKDVTGDISVKTTVACAYTSTSVARFQAVSLNPLSTAWELIPYSFVVDWFVGVGDYITAEFSQNLAEQVMACTAVRTRKTETYTLNRPNNQTITGSWTGTTGSPCWGSVPAAPTVTVGGAVGALRTVETNTYDRTLFARDGVAHLRLGPVLNWKRYADAVALSTNIIKGLKALYR